MKAVYLSKFVETLVKENVEAFKDVSWSKDSPSKNESIAMEVARKDLFRDDLLKSLLNGDFSSLSERDRYDNMSRIVCQSSVSEKMYNIFMVSIENNKQNKTKEELFAAIKEIVQGAKGRNILQCLDLFYEKGVL